MIKKIIIDTDPGIDDAMAILFAHLSPQIEVLGITTTFGNVPVALATKNALILNDVAEVNIPVAEGVAVPLKSPPRSHPDFVHGKDGFGNIGWATSSQKAIDKTAAQYIVDAIREYPGEITMVGLGPLGNLAKALEMDPGIVQLVKDVVLMGGAYRVNGNVSPVAEANIICDPHAADIVFSAAWPVTMVGLDVTTQVLLQRKCIDRIRLSNKKQGEFIFQSAQFYFEFYHDHVGINGCYFHDGSTIAYVLQPELFEVELGRVRVACEGIATGQTIVAPDGIDFLEEEWADIPTSKICMGVDSDRLLKLFEDTLSRK